MKFYDYAWCFIFADIISASIVSFNLPLFIIGVIGYMIYEKFATWRID